MAVLDPMLAAEYLRLTRVMLRAQHVVDDGGDDVAQRAYAIVLEDWLRFGARHPDLLDAVLTELEPKPPPVEAR